MSAPYKRIEFEKTLTGSFVKSEQKDIRWFNQHELQLTYAPDGGSGAGVELQVKIFISNESLGTARDSSKWRRYGRYRNLNADGILTFTPRLIRARAEIADDLKQSFQFPFGGKKMYIEYQEDGTPGTFGTFDAELFSYSD